MKRALSIVEIPCNPRCEPGRNPVSFYLTLCNPGASSASRRYTRATRRGTSRASPRCLSKYSLSKYKTRAINSMDVQSTRTMHAPFTSRAASRRPASHMHMHMMSSQYTGDLHLVHTGDRHHHTQATGIDLERMLFFDNERGKFRDDACSNACTVYLVENQFIYHRPCMCMCTGNCRDVAPLGVTCSFA